MKRFFAPLVVVTGALFAIVPFLIANAPIESTMGLIQKIFYFHVPSWMAMYTAIAVCGIGSALYLLAMAGCAWYLRSFGGAWGPLMQVAWMAGAAIVLAGVLFSGAMRAHAKVFISKHFYQTGFDYREEWQRFTRTLSLEGPDLGLRAVQALAALVESPAGALWLRRNDAAGDRCEPSACWNLARQHGDASAAFCQFLEQRQWVLDVPDSLAQPDRYDGLELPPWLHGVPQLWLLVPLMLHGRLYGVVALTQPRTALELNWEVRDLLKIAGSQAAS